MKLTQKQENFKNDLFAEVPQRVAYMNHYNAKNMSPAAIDVEASKLAHSPKVALSLEEMRQAAKSGLIANEIERKEILTEIMRGRIGNFLDSNQRIKQGVPLTDASIQEVETYDIKIGKGENARMAQVTKFKLHNPIQAIAEINKMEKVYTEGGVNIDNRTLIINVNSEKARSLTERLIDGERTE